jgi:methylmalonyl-CoA/ethylmalonyl-CoA epimerase
MMDFKLLWRKKLDKLNSEVAFLKLGDFQIGLYQHKDSIPLPLDRREPAKDLQTQGIKHVCYAVDDVAKILDHLRAKGAEVVIGPMEMDGNIIGFVRDNMGNPIEFQQTKP